MMHANACCTCNLISTRDMLGYYNRVFSRTHYSDDFTNASYSHAEQECVTQINVCSTSCLKCQSVCLFASSKYVWDNHTCEDYNGHIRCAYTVRPPHGLKRVYVHDYMHVSILH